MISLEGLTLTTGRHVEAGYILRTFAYYIRDGLIPNLFPEGQTRASTTPPTRPSGSSTRSTATSTPPATAPRSSCCCPGSSTSSSTTSRGRASASASTRPTACCARAQEGYQLTWMDAKVGDWVVTPRRGKAVEINALWYNALRLLEGWVRDLRGESDAPAPGRARRRASDARSTSGSGTPSGATSTTWSTASSGDDPACRPNQIFAISLPHPVLDRVALGAGRRGRPPPAPDAGRPALAGPRPSRLQGQVLRRPPRARRRLPPGHGLGLADRPVHRRLAEGPPRRPRRRPPLPRGLRPAPGRGVRRLDQRDLRRRGAVHPARLHRPGLERRRGAALLGQDGRLRQVRDEANDPVSFVFMCILATETAAMAEGSGRVRKERCHPWRASQMVQSAT